MTTNYDILRIRSLQLGAAAVYAFDEASGDLIDHAGSNDGTITGTPTREVADQRGAAGAYTFGGSGDYITLSSQIMDSLTAYTVEAVFKVAAGAPSLLHILDHRDGGGDGFRLSCSIPVATRVLGVEHNDSSGTLRSNSEIVEDQWYHVHVTWDGTNIRAYINGVLDETEAESSALSLSDPPLVSGRSFSTPNTNNFEGEISHIAIYPSDLDQDDIDSLIAAAYKVGERRTINRTINRASDRGIS